MAADIYEAPPQGRLRRASSSPLDRGIYIKGYIGQANPDVGSIWTEGYDTNTFTVHHEDIKARPLFGLGIGWQHSHWLRFDLTGEYRGDALFVGHDQYPGGFGFTRHERVHGRHPELARPRQRLHRHGQLVRLHALRRRRHRLRHDLGRRPEGHQRPAATASFFGADNTNTNFAWALYAGVSYDVTPQIALDLAYRYANLGTAQSGVVTAFDDSSSYSGLFIKDITSNDLMLGFRYKLQREASLYAGEVRLCRPRRAAGAPQASAGPAPQARQPSRPRPVDRGPPRVLKFDFLVRLRVRQAHSARKASSRRGLLFSRLWKRPAGSDLRRRARLRPPSPSIEGSSTMRRTLTSISLALALGAGAGARRRCAAGRPRRRLRRGPVYSNGINPYGARDAGPGADPRARLRARVVLPRRFRRRLRLPASVTTTGTPFAGAARSGSARAGSARTSSRPSPAASASATSGDRTSAPISRSTSTPS